jgi:hypothetical protein
LPLFFRGERRSSLAPSLVMYLARYLRRAAVIQTEQKKNYTQRLKHVLGTCLADGRLGLSAVPLGVVQSKCLASRCIHDEQSLQAALVFHTELGGTPNGPDGTHLCYGVPFVRLIVGIHCPSVVKVPRACVVLGVAQSFGSHGALGGGGKWILRQGTVVVGNHWPSDWGMVQRLVQSPTIFLAVPTTIDN